jgi:tRNA uracil 4-sulfurtransferase
MKRCFVCHYHEIGLKGSNRSFFENRLLENIRKALDGLPIGPVRRVSGRVLVEITDESPEWAIGPRLQKVFGLAYSSLAWVSGQDLDQLQDHLWSLVEPMEFDTFKIHARRAGKNFPLNSQQLNERLGAFIQGKCGKRVKLEDPDLTCHVDLVERHALLYFVKLRGPGGLPISSSGKVVVLLSGGIDSPVAAYRIMKRGCRAVFVHFHSYPHTTLESQEKVRQLVRILDEYQYGSILYLVPFAEAQRQIVAYTPPETRVILYRRLMVRIAERVAARERALALVTGDSIGQVASQTVENLSVIGQATRMPLLRPLVGDDKEEIIQRSRQIGTMELSVIPETDCCSLFIPRHPETRADLAGIERTEMKLDMETLIEDALKRCVVERISFKAPLDIVPPNRKQ